MHTFFLPLAKAVMWDNPELIWINRIAETWLLVDAEGALLDGWYLWQTTCVCSRER